MGGKSSTISTSEQRILSLQVQQSSYGLSIPIVYGRTRVAGNLIWYGDFTAIEHTTTTRQGGKGGGGVTQKDTKYTYEAAVMMALAEGGIKDVVSVWRDKERFYRLSDIGLSLAKGDREQAAWGWLTTKHPAQAIGYSNTAYVYGANYQLTNSAQIYNHNFEVDGKLAYGNGTLDANPRDVLIDLLTSTQYGCNFPARNLADTSIYSTYCRALGVFLSPAYTEQREAHEIVSELLAQTNSAAVWSDGKLKIIPYGDTPASGNGAVYIPNLTPLYDLTDDDFIVSGAEDPVRCDRKTPADAFNQVHIEYLDRANAYNVAIAEAKDQANIEQYGLRPKEPIQMHSVCDTAVAHQIAHLTLQRALYVRNEYEFRLGWKYVLLEPMDLVTLTDEGLGLNKTPVRITEIEEDEDGTLTIKAEDFPFGTASATSYPTQPSLGYSANYNTAPGNAYAPVIFEVPLQLTGNEPQIWMATAGGDDWGGADVWVSTDGDSYKRIGTVTAKARYGSTSSILPVGATYDNSNNVGVDLSAVSGGLISATEQDARDLLTACYLDGEFIAYKTATLTGAGKYNLSGLVRGAWGSNIDRHDAGKPFVRMDEALFKYSFPPEWLNKTIWIKLVSYNVYGSGAQNLSEVSAYPYTIIGAPLGTVQNLRLSTPWAYGRQCTIQWDLLAGADSYDIEVYSGTENRLLRTVTAVADNQYTYTLQDMKSDGGQGRYIVFKVRGRAVTGKTGGWAQVVAQNPQLSALTGINVEQGLKQAFFKCETPSDDDFAGIILWASTDPACPITDENKIYDGADTFIVINKVGGKELSGGINYYVRAAGYDGFGKDGLNISSSVAFTVFEVSKIAKDLTESNLFGALRDRIGLIDAPETQQGSVNARIKAVESTAATDLLNKATELGTRITAVENVNTTQAQQIVTVTAAQNGFTAGLEAEKQARIAGDAAEASARETLSARLNGAESSITTLNQTVSSHSSAISAQETVISAKIDEKIAALDLSEQVTTTIDLRASVFDINTYYPVIMRLPDIKRRYAFRVFQELTQKTPVVAWATHHTNSFSMDLYWYVSGNGWGSQDIRRMIDRYDYAFTKLSCPPALRIEQNGFNSTEVVYLRGGGVYEITHHKTVVPQAKSSLYETFNSGGSVQSVEPYFLGDLNDPSVVNLIIKDILPEIRSEQAKVQAMYSLKVEAVANGRMAVAGIALGADGVTGDTQFLVKADKFAVVNQNSTAQIAVPFIVDAPTNTVGINGNLVVQGKAIIDKLNAGDINGDKIAANTIMAAHLQAGSVTAAKIAAGTITGDRIAADQTISAPNIIGGSLNIGSGRFIVNSSGNVNISAAAGNVGLKITNEKIEVYDEAGRLRVRMGKLS